MQRLKTCNAKTSDVTKTSNTRTSTFDRSADGSDLDIVLTQNLTAKFRQRDQPFVKIIFKSIKRSAHRGYLQMRVTVHKTRKNSGFAEIFDRGIRKLSSEIG